MNNVTSEVNAESVIRNITPIYPRLYLILQQRQ